MRRRIRTGFNVKIDVEGKEDAQRARKWPSYVTGLMLMFTQGHSHDTMFTVNIK